MLLSCGKYDIIIGMEAETSVWKVEAFPHAVVAYWRTSVTINGEEIASKEGETVFRQNSDWSETEPLVQKVCQAVFNG